MDITRLKRGVKDRVRDALSVRLVMSKQVAVLFEEIHLKRFVKHYQVDCVFDVGANNGQYAEMLRKRVGYKGPIVSFEPVPKAAEILRGKAKDDPDWYVEQVALDRVSGTSVFNVMSENQFSSLHTPSDREVDLFRDKNRVTQRISVETATLKDVYEKYRRLVSFERPFLKMDTQGHDLDIAQGGGAALKAFVGLQSELSIKKIYANTDDFDKVIDYYKLQGFELSAFVPNNEGHFPRLIEVDCIMYNKEMSASR